MPAFNNQPRRPSYPTHHGSFHVHREIEMAPPFVEPVPEMFGHQRSQSYHGFQADGRPVSQPSATVSSADPLSASSFYTHPHQPAPNMSQDRTPRTQGPSVIARRSSRDDMQQYYDRETSSSSSSLQPRQRSMSSSGFVGVPHYQDPSTGSFQPPSRSPGSQHSSQTTPPPVRRHSGSPQTPPLTPSPQEYSGQIHSHHHLQQHLQQQQQQQQQLQQHPSHRHPHSARPAPVAAGRAVHKVSSREPATVGPNRRLAHILSEQKRREKINGGFDELKSVIPE